MTSTNELPTHREAISCLSALIAPMSWSDFLADHWDRSPMYVEGRDDSFRHLATASEVRRLVASGSPWQFRRLPEMYLDAGFVGHEHIVQEYVDMDGRTARAPILARINSLLDAGATVNCFGQEVHFPALAALKDNFAVALAAEVETSFFYSQENHQGLAPHYDCVEIFVLQISGQKRWHLSTQRVENPLVGTGSPVVYDTSALHATFDMSPGDVLYIPRGLFHQAVALSTESLHTSIAVKVPNYLDMLHVLVGVASDRSEMRGYLPHSMTPADGFGTFLEEVGRTLHTEQYRTALNEMLRIRAKLGREDHARRT